MKKSLVISVIFIVSLIALMGFGCTSKDAPAGTGGEAAAGEDAGSDSSLDILSEEELAAILEDDGTSLSDEQKLAILDKAAPLEEGSSGEDQAVAGNSIARGLVRSNPAAVRARWTRFTASIPTACINNFKATDELYKTMVREYGATQNKMRIYVTP